MYTRMCFVEIEDFYECKMKKKHRAFKNYVMAEMKKTKIYSLPKYDFANDTFSDGPLPKDADEYFGLAKEKQTYYSWKKKVENKFDNMFDNNFIFKLIRKNNSYFIVFKLLFVI